MYRNELNFTIRYREKLIIIYVILHLSTKHYKQKKIFESSITFSFIEHSIELSSDFIEYWKMIIIFCDYIWFLMQNTDLMFTHQQIVIYYFSGTGNSKK